MPGKGRGGEAIDHPWVARDERVGRPCPPSSGGPLREHYGRATGGRARWHSTVEGSMNLWADAGLSGMVLVHGSSGPAGPLRLRRDADPPASQCDGTRSPTANGRRRGRAPVPRPNTPERRGRRAGAPEVARDQVEGRTAHPDASTARRTCLGPSSGSGESVHSSGPVATGPAGTNRPCSRGPPPRCARGRGHYRDARSLSSAGRGHLRPGRCLHRGRRHDGARDGVPSGVGRGLGPKSWFARPGMGQAGRGRACAPGPVGAGPDDEGVVT